MPFISQICPGSFCDWGPYAFHYLNLFRFCLWLIWEQIQFCIFVRNDQSAVSLFSPARSSLVRASLTVSRILKTPPSPSLSRSTPSVSSVNNTRACKYTQLHNRDHHVLDSGCQWKKPTIKKHPGFHLYIDPYNQKPQRYWQTLHSAWIIYKQTISWWQTFTTKTIRFWQQRC